MADRKDVPDSPDESAMRIDPDLVRELAELLTENELTEIEVKDGERKIKVRREAAAVGGAVSPAQIAAFGMLRNDVGATAPAEVPGALGAVPAAEEVAGNSIKSPMVGTAYLSAEPGAKPFVAVGDAVKAGDTLLIVEAMKVMNPITATSGGVVKKILVSDGQPVEFDQPLVIVG
ncbi:MAG TPA: acetyl-CoA carboxylase biotin carboxyl carrier protein [Sphingomicrobium sp.]|nr:acetyl-CoA carboxylase biotin carboxyl carrier protein [Sphingomicrobium sp.]